MSKRYIQYSSRAQVHKKPKLDICYSSRNDQVSKTTVPVNNSKLKVNNAESLWGDDGEDEEVILLASQIVEQLEQCSENVGNNKSLDEVTFSNFNRDKEIKTSTQIIRPENIYTDFLEEGLDVFNNIEESVKGENSKRSNGNRPNGSFKDLLLKVPHNMEVGPSKHKAESSEKANNGNNCLRKDSKEIQVNYLMGCIENLKQENDKLSKKVVEFNEKVQTKDGEISMLRHELGQAKKVNDNMRLEKIKENEMVKKEWQDKIEELEKQLKAHQSKLDFKNLEISNLKTRKLNESQCVMDTSVLTVKTDYNSLPSLHRLHLTLNFYQDIDSFRVLPKEIFTKSVETNLGFRETVFCRHLEALQSILAQMNSIKVLDKTMENFLFKKVSQICKSSIIELNNYIKNLEYPKYRDTNANVEYKFLCQNRAESVECNIHKYQKKNLFQEHPLFPNEKAILIRRVVAAIALLCKYLKPIRLSLFQERIGELTLMEILVKSINSCGYSKEIFNHAGLMESFGMLLNSSIYPITEDNATVLSQYLKYLIFCRPEEHTLVELSKFLAIIGSRSKDILILNSLCNKSNENHFFVNEFYKIFLFSPDSCPLQVYGVLFEVAFPQYQLLTWKQSNVLIEICYNHAKFLRNSSEKVAHWILTLESSCDCYPKITGSFVVLLYLTINQWIRDPRSIDIKKISKISRIGSLVLCDIFHTNYRSDVLLSGGSIIKHRLHIIHDWLMENKTLFRFKEPHRNALNFIKSLHAMTDPFKICDEQFSESESKSIGNNIWHEVFDNFI